MTFTRIKIPRVFGHTHYVRSSQTSSRIAAFWIRLVALFICSLLATVYTVSPAQASSGDKIEMVSGGTTSMTHGLQKTADPIPATYPGVSLDVLGIKPGMGLEAATRILVAYYKSEPKSVAGTIRSNYKHVVFIKSQPYTSVLSDSNKAHTDYIQVYFGNQTTGNTVIAIDRKITYNAKTGPELTPLIAALDKKYGAQTQMGIVNQPNWDLHWVFGQHHLLKSCPKTGCHCPSSINPRNNLSMYDLDIKGDLNTDNSYFYAKAAMSSAEYACVDAEAYPLESDKSRASDLEIILKDPADEVLTLRQAKKQLHAAAVAVYQKEVKPAKIPKL